MPSLGLSRDPEDGTFKFNFGVGMGSSVEQVANQGEKILDNPYLATSSGLGTLLQYTLTQKGAWLPPSSSTKGITKHFIRIVESHDPQEDSLSIGVSSDGKLRTIGFGNWNVHSIEYGSNSLLANSPSWPDLTVEERGEFDFASFISFATYNSICTSYICVFYFMFTRFNRVRGLSGECFAITWGTPSVCQEVALARACHGIAKE